MSDNQKLVDDYFEISYIDSVEPQIYAGDAKELIESMVKNEKGFELTLNRLERMVYINYKTKLKNPVKDSLNPTNKITLTSEDTTASSTFSVALVGGRGDAIGENKTEPTWELPTEAPTVEIPELDINDIPFLPPAPILEKPELSLEDIPMMPPAPIVDVPELPLDDIPLLPPAPILEKPELSLENIPLMPPAPVVDIPELPLEDIPLLPPAPILEKPYLPIEDIPMMPPVPILELPELKITEEPKETPTSPTSEKPVKKNDKPKGNTPVPTTPVPNTPVKNSSEQNTSVKNTSVKKAETDIIQKQNSESTKTLPNTGESASALLVIIGLTILSASISTLLRKK